MELKLDMSESTTSLANQFGIPDERSTYLLQTMDTKFEEMINSNNPPISIAQIIVEIAKVCNSTEEIVLCAISNTIFMVRNGFLDLEDSDK